MFEAALSQTEYFRKYYDKRSVAPSVIVLIDSVTHEYTGSKFRAKVT